MTQCKQKLIIVIGWSLLSLPTHYVCLSGITSPIYLFLHTESYTVQSHSFNTYISVYLWFLFVPPTGDTLIHKLCCRITLRGAQRSWRGLPLHFCPGPLCHTPVRWPSTNQGASLGEVAAELVYIGRQVHGRHTDLREGWWWHQTFCWRTTDGSLHRRHSCWGLTTSYMHASMYEQVYIWFTTIILWLELCHQLAVTVFMVHRLFTPW